MDRPGPPLRLAVLANFDSPHAWRWIKVFIARGHEVHAISYYEPSRDLPGATLHVLRPGCRGAGGQAAVASARGGGLPPTARRLLNAVRFQRAGLGRLVRDIAPHVFQAHFVVEHAFFGALAGYHPYVVNAWGSDLFQAPKTPAGASLARYVLRHADLLSANDPALARAAVRLGMPEAKTAVISLGLDREWLDGPVNSVNLQPDPGPPSIISDRALEPLYNVDTLVRAFGRVQERMPGVRLRIAGTGSQRAALQTLARECGVSASVEFLGQVEQERLRALLRGSQVYVSVPDSDSFALSSMEAMAEGVFPVVTDLESQDGWITHRLNGMRVPARDAGALAESLLLALADHDLRRRALKTNRAKVEADGDLEKNMLALERHFYRLAGFDA